MKWYWKKLYGLKEPINETLWLKNVLFTRSNLWRFQKYKEFWSSREGEYQRWYPVREVLNKRNFVTVQRLLKTVTRSLLHYHSYISSDKKRGETLQWMNILGARRPEPFTQFGVPYELLWTHHILKAYINSTHTTLRRTGELWFLVKK